MTESGGLAPEAFASLIWPNDRVSIYKCYNHTQYRTLCNRPTTYRAESVDVVVEKLLRDIFERSRSINESELIQQ